MAVVLQYLQGMPVYGRGDHICVCYTHTALSRLERNSSMLTLKKEAAFGEMASWQGTVGSRLELRGALADSSQENKDLHPASQEISSVSKLNESV